MRLPKGAEAGFQFVEQRGSKAPAVHGNYGGEGKFLPVARLGQVGGGGFAFFNFYALGHTDEHTVLNLAFPAGNGAVFGQRVAEMKPDHAMVRGLSRDCGIRKMRGKMPEGVGPVKVVGVDHGKRIVPDRFGGAVNGVAGAPWLYAAFRQNKPGGEVVKVLKGVLYADLFLNAVADGFAESRLVFPFDQKHHAVKARANGVVNRKINNEITRVGHGVQLFEPAVA